MYLKKLFYTFFLSSLFTLNACGQQPSHMYLMEHPDKLKKEVMYCESAQHPDEQYCLMVRRSAQDFYSLVSLRRSNPEEFGKQIISAEQYLVKLRNELQTAEKSNSANSQQVKDAEKAVEEQTQKVHILLAVVGSLMIE